MKTRVAAICASACMLCWLSPAKADVTYTWDVTSSSFESGSAPDPFSLSFTVSGNLDFSANSSFTAASDPTVEYPFPGALTAFSLDVGHAPLTLASFTNQRAIAGGNAFPKWDMSLTANPRAGTADLSLSYGDEGLYDYFLSGAFETGTSTTVNYDADGMPDGESYTGVLTTSDPLANVPEPSALALLASALAGLSLIRSARKSATPAG